jgi:hypothetical protein
MENYKKTNLNCNTKREIKFIQSDTYLIIKKDTEIIGYSENIFEYLDNFNNLIKDKNEGDYIVKDNDISYYCHCYKSGDYLLFEFEEYVYIYDGIDLDLSLEYLNLINLENNKNIDNILINTIGKITKFDRVILYKFDKNWSGKVISEYNLSNKNSLYNQYFPESDIPQYVRQLFCKNKIRYIRNSYEVGYKIIYKNDYIDIDLDASLSNILNVTSKSHQKHLDTMKVTSSYSLALIINNQLYGLIICHLFNTSEKVDLSVSSRHHCEKLVKIYNKKLEENILNKNIQMKTFFNNLSLLNTVLPGYNNIEYQTNLQYFFKQVLFYIDADYFISNINGDCFSYNIDIEKCSSLFYLINKSSSTIDKNNTFYIKNNNNWICFFKTNLENKIKWAGNPELILYNNLDNTFLPRDDFSLYEIETSTKWDIYNKDFIITFIENILVNST